MNQKDLIRYGLIALGAYLIYRYIQDHGGIEGLFGTTVAAAGPPVIGAPVHPAIPGGTALNVAQPVPDPVLDMTGLVVQPDVNDSLTGWVKINGVPLKLSLIPADGRIFDASGSDITASLQGRGVDVVAIRTAFQAATPITNGTDLTGAALSGLGWTPPWMVN